MTQFVPLSTAGRTPDEARRILRLNCLGSLYFFIKIALKRRRLSDRLHLPFCRSLERPFLKDVKEFPRDHFKSTICSEGLPMWWALPFGNEDADFLAKLDYPDEYIRWMRKAHNPNGRFLLVSENITNAAKLGKRIRWHFESNALYRSLFPETLPDTSCIWTNFSLHVRRPTAGTGGSHGEGTFDFLGVGGALQSRHYDGVIEDDLVGRKAIESQTVMDQTIDYHRLLIGAFDSEDRDHENSELVVGNRWSFHDMNSYIRENEPWFVFSTHSALGGCCEAHPPDMPIFEEEWSFEKLMRAKGRLGNYHFSCQYLNNPAAPENADFDTEWLGYFALKESLDKRRIIAHEVKDGTVRKDLLLGHLSLCMASDPNHAGNAAAGRCRHSIVVIGLSSSGDYYLLDCWAAHASYDAYIAKIYELAAKWGLRKFGLETVAAQKYLAYHIEYRNRIESRTLRIIPLKGEVEAPDGTLTKKKEWRIRNVLSPIFESGRFFTQRKFQDFLGEYSSFPSGKFVDILDAMAYVPQMLKTPMNEKLNQELLARNRTMARNVNAPYAMAVQ